MLKRLFGAVVEGFGHRAGSRLLDEAVRDLSEGDPPAKPLTPEQARQESKRIAAEAKAREAAAKKAEAERKKQAQQREREIDAELKALKKRVAKQP
jgi:hypothetical protein